MKKFKFNLQPLLDHKEMLEELARKDYMEIADKLRKEEERLKVYVDLYRRFSENLDTMKKDGMEVSELRFQYRYIDSIKEFIESQKKLIAELKKAAEEKRAELTRASINKKVVEKAKERKKEEYDREVKRQEQKIMDEVAVSGFVRRKGE